MWLGVAGSDYLSGGTLLARFDYGWLSSVQTRSLPRWTEEGVFIF